MYTQCPECLTAFRVTESLLQQASGRVRCGSCGHAFSALEHLSEEPPPAAEGAAEGPAAEDGGDEDALLDTFTDLSEFEDIRIEDTGVEWRVVDEEEVEDETDGDGHDGGESAVIADESDDAPPAEEGPLPEVREVVAEPGDDSGILVEESGIREPQAALDLAGGDPAEPRYDDNTPLPAGEAIAVSAEPEVPRRRATDHIEPRSPEFDERQSDLELGAPEEWRELLDEFGAAESEPAPAPPSAPPGAGDGEPDDMPSDIDTQFNLQAVAIGIEVTGNREASGMAEEWSAEDEAAGEPTVDFPLEEQEESASIDFDPGTTGSPGVDFEVPAEEARAAVDFDPGDDRPEEDSEFDFREAFEAELAAAEQEEREAKAREADLDAELNAAFAPQEELPAADRAADFELPPQTEEEMTINMQIDQDLMRAAAEESFDPARTGEWRKTGDSLLVETIVMEGDFVRSALDQELDAVVESVGGMEDDPRRLFDTYVRPREPIRGGRRRTDPAGYPMIAAVAVLGVLLLAQVVHAYRETLATHAAFNSTVGSVYRLFGDPLVPQWNVRGWRFEATSGGTDAGDEVLTIRSRISNQSGGALPYPLLHVALTDRFEEVIGSRVLQPEEYLDAGRDAAARVAAGDQFDATITVESVSQAATGFKLNVCYREDAGRLRCATEDFRD